MAGAIAQNPREAPDAVMLAIMAHTPKASGRAVPMVRDGRPNRA